MNKNMIKKLLLMALLIPSSLIVASELPVRPVQMDTIMGNLGDSVAGFQNFFYKTALASSRFTLSASKTASNVGDYFADNHLVFGGVATVALLGLGYYYFSRPSGQWINIKDICKNGKKLYVDGKQYVLNKIGR